MTPQNVFTLPSLRAVSTKLLEKEEEVKAKIKIEGGLGATERTPIDENYDSQGIFMNGESKDDISPLFSNQKNLFNDKEHV